MDATNHGKVKRKEAKRKGMANNQDRKQRI